VWCPDSEDESDALVVYAHSPDGAASEWAALIDHSSDGRIAADEEEVVVCVRLSTGKVYRYSVTGEIVAHYSATFLGAEEAE